MATLPLLDGHTLDSIVTYHEGEVLSAARFIAHAERLAAALPPHSQVINLCEDRYYFLLAFAAALLRRQSTLLPPNRADETIAQLKRDYGESYLISDRPADYARHGCFDCRLPHDGARAEAIPEVACGWHCVTLYTSGSSGEAQPHHKSWEMLVAGARLNGERLAIPPATTLLATVPPQHMFGLETSVMLPLQYGCAIDSRRPLFPADIAAALATLPEPRALITTPLQLRACAAAQQQLPPGSFILSATAPLSAELARQVESLSGTRVKEIYGSTETGAVATRDTAHEEAWLPLPGVEFEQQEEERWLLRAPHLPQPQPLADRLAWQGGRFTLLGRSGDLIKVAGKRVSLGDLNHILHSIDGVEDGLFVMPEEESDGRTTRLAAVAVSSLDEAALLEALRQRIDAAFLPRPLVLVERLPRNETGKLPRGELLALITPRKRTG